MQARPVHTRSPSLQWPGCGRRIEVGEQAVVLDLALARAPGIELVIEVDGLEAVAGRVAQRLQSSSGKRVVQHGAGEQHPDWPRIVIGDGSGAQSRRLAEYLGIGLKGASSPSFTYDGHSFGQPDRVLLAAAEDRERRGLPVTLLLGA